MWDCISVESGRVAAEMREAMKKVASGGWLVVRKRRTGEGVGRSEMAQEQRPRSITAKA